MEFLESKTDFPETNKRCYLENLSSIEKCRIIGAEGQKIKAYERKLEVMVKDIGFG